MAETWQVNVIRVGGHKSKKKNMADSSTQQGRFRLAHQELGGRAESWGRAGEISAEKKKKETKFRWRASQNDRGTQIRAGDQKPKKKNWRKNRPAKPTSPPTANNFPGHNPGEAGSKQYEHQDAWRWHHNWQISVVPWQLDRAAQRFFLVGRMSIEKKPI